jgi:hypothetical protein
MHPAVVLKKASTFPKQIRAGVLAACQFPPEMQDATGTAIRLLAEL